MPCGEPCKIIIDGMAGLIQSLTCMKNSILLNAANGGDGPPAELRGELMTSMSELASLAQKVAANTPAGG
jgi:hypothetical protein